jgi:hypothetical protein
MKRLVHQEYVVDRATLCNSTALTTTVTVKIDTHCQATFAEPTPVGTSPRVPVATPRGDEEGEIGEGSRRGG